MTDNSACGRHYDREFKQNAVALVRGGESISQVGRDLGVSQWSLGRWVQAANGGHAQSESKTLATETDEQRELRRLRQEVDYLREQRDILKKSAQASCQRRCRGALHADGNDERRTFPACPGAGLGGVGQRLPRAPTQKPGPAPTGGSGSESGHPTRFCRQSADRWLPADHGGLAPGRGMLRQESGGAAHA